MTPIPTRLLAMNLTNCSYLIWKTLNIYFIKCKILLSAWIICFSRRAHPRSVSCYLMARCRQTNVQLRWDAPTGQSRNGFGCACSAKAGPKRRCKFRLISHQRRSVFPNTLIEPAEKRIEEIRHHASRADLQFRSYCHARNELNLAGGGSQLSIRHVRQNPVVRRGIFV